MATRRLATNGAVTALRGGTSRLTSSGSATIPTTTYILQAPFGTTSLGPQATRGAVGAGAVARPQLFRRISPISVRWSSDSAAESKIWKFEEIKAALSTPTSTPKVTIIDTREPSELSSTGRIPGALNIPIASAPDSFHIPADEFADRFGFERPAPDSDGPVVFYCKAGVRSRAAAQIAREAGWKNVGEYPGSWLDWVRRGGEIER
ncbi:Thiosulfate sulfurtransferase RDL2, mitochondrial [Daldinia childiae]|uniref:Thiosulfate sulfurtransferase RDL2, mitochondrial n=1 Tax=Daldinia childiae TaxID=326645 RepID=UPI0014451D06|nr:Thiosulfate sulfurtransferase RDL2, mitochondrial [Daldinia childiae]KAF3062001.1 Thiosulfate sulfurtransferase RDL2, mitochondrial [Daldinia childiae]